MKKIITLTLTSICFYFSAFSQSIPPFKEGERAVFMGNSITNGGYYHSYIWLYYMTRFPDMNVRIINAGVGGDNAYNMYKRLDGDVFDKRPTTLMVTFGMNDSGYFEYNSDKAHEFGEEKYHECFKNYQMIEERLKQLYDTKIVMLGSSPYDETSIIEGNEPFKGKNSVMERIVAFQKESAKSNNWSFLDFNQPMTEINRRMQNEDTTFTLCGGDRIHPDNDGHMVMAYLFLKAQGFAGQKVADIEIDASKQSVVKSENCGITNIKKTGKDFSFNYLANSLPYPLDVTARGWGAKRSQSEANLVVPFVDEMNQEILKVTGLKGNYKLMIDDEEIGIWSGDDLSKGINLAGETKTPQYQQAIAIMHLNEYRREIESSFRDFAWIQFNFFQEKGLLFANNTKSLELMNKEAENNMWIAMHKDIYAKYMHQSVRELREQEMELILSRIYEINKPLTRKIVLRDI